MNNEYLVTIIMTELVKAVKNATPKKPRAYIDFNGIIRMSCPSCDRYEILYAGQKYCSVCGQRIDWSDDDDKK